MERTAPNMADSLKTELAGDDLLALAVKQRRLSESECACYSRNSHDVGKSARSLTVFVEELPRLAILHDMWLLCDVFGIRSTSKRHVDSSLRRKGDQCPPVFDSPVNHTNHTFLTYH